ncbi:MAG TPA: zinc-dependent metalloprotease [Kineosporiaceae bacterium]
MSGDGPDEPRPPSGNDPLGDMMRQFLSGGTGGMPDGLAGIPGLPADPAALQAMLAQVQQLLTGSGDGPVNWAMAHDVARQTAAEGGDPSISEAQQRQVAEALRTADLWLDRVCDVPSATARTEAWSRAEWVEHTLPVWKGVVEPVAASVGDAMTEAMASQAPPEMRAMLSGALPMLRRMGGAFFGAQLGQAIGTLAREVVGASDVGLPLLPPGRAALLPGNVAEFGAGLDLSEDEVRLYLALREAAHARLFSSVPWLRSHLLGAVADYARGITIDTSTIEEAVRSIDPTDAESLQNALSSGLFEPQRTPAQQATLDRLEILLALIEGWVDEVVDAAARGSLPHAAALRETVRRRRASGGPAEHTFASLVGLELRPRRLREAAAVWAAVSGARGTQGRDALWAHPDLVPTADAFADPEAFARPPAEDPGAADLDAALREILAGSEQHGAVTGSPQREDAGEPGHGQGGSRSGGETHGGPSGTEPGRDHGTEGEAPRDAR